MSIKLLFFFLTSKGWDMPDKTKGLINKFKVHRLNQTLESVEKHGDCRYFVLDPQHDPGAVAALQTYAEWCYENGYLPLADDLFEWIRKIRHGN